MSPLALERAREIAKKITDALGGYGIFGVEPVSYTHLHNSRGTDQKYGPDGMAR